MLHFWVLGSPFSLLPHTSVFRKCSILMQFFLSWLQAETKATQNLFGKKDAMEISGKNILRHKGVFQELNSLYICSFYFSIMCWFISIDFSRPASKFFHKLANKFQVAL